MLNKQKLIIGTVLASTLLLPTAYGDDDSGLYIAGSANRLSADFKDVNDAKFDDSDSAGGVRLGYMSSGFLGFELGYLDLGSYSATGETAGNNISLDADAFTAAVVLNWEVVPQIDIYTRFGALFIDANSDSFVAGQTFSAGSRETEAFGAIGVEFDFGALNLFAEFSKADTSVNDLTLDIASVGLKYEFGGY